MSLLFQKKSDYAKVIIISGISREYEGIWLVAACSSAGRSRRIFSAAVVSHLLTTNIFILKCIPVSRNSELVKDLAAVEEAVGLDAEKVKGEVAF